MQLPFPLAEQGFTPPVIYSFQFWKTLIAFLVFVQFKIMIGGFVCISEQRQKLFSQARAVTMIYSRSFCPKPTHTSNFLWSSEPQLGTSMIYISKKIILLGFISLPVTCCNCSAVFNKGFRYMLVSSDPEELQLHWFKTGMIFKYKLITACKQTCPETVSRPISKLHISRRPDSSWSKSTTPSSPWEPRDDLMRSAC